MFGSALKHRINLQIFGLLFVLTLLFLPTAQALFVRWTKWDQALSHGLPTLGLFAYFLWQANFSQSAQDSGLTRFFLYLSLALCSLLWFLFQINQIELLSALTFVATFAIYVAASASIRTAWRLAPVWALLLFTTPLLSLINDGLVTLSSLVVGKLISLSNMTALIEGNNIFIPSGRIVIADGCSGLRYLTVSLLLGYITCLLNSPSFKQTAAVIACSLALGLIANWLRIFLLVVVGYYTEMKSDLMHNHETFGWFIFFIIMAPALYFAPVNKRSVLLQVPTPPLRPIIPSLIVALGPLLMLASSHQAPTQNPLTLRHLNLQQTNLRSDSAVTLSFNFSKDINSLETEINHIPVRIDLIKYQPQGDEKLVPYFETLYNKDEWIAQQEPPKTLIKNFELNLLKKINGREKVAVAQQYLIGESATNDYFVAKLLQLKARALNQRYFGVLIIQTPCDSDCESAEQRLALVAREWEESKKWPQN